MAFDPLEFLGLATELLSGGFSEVKGRTAISRAYYAVFLVIREKLIAAGARFEVGRVHRDVIVETKKKNWHVGNLLEKLYDDRIKADYKIREKIDFNDCNKSIRLAELLRKELHKL